MEKKTTLKVPEAYLPLLEDIRLLQKDESNPNVTTLRQQEQIWASLQKYGWTYPILTNKDGVLLDGAQRTDICLQHGEYFAPVLRLPVTDVDRRLLRQILNKLKGKHNKELDAAEYMRIAEMGEKEGLKALLASIGERLPQEQFDREFSVTIPATYELIIECHDEADQKGKFEKLKGEGYKLRILTL
jgi:hypothetical protein